jgi:hypothetical protein
VFPPDRWAWLRRPKMVLVDEARATIQKSTTRIFFCPAPKRTSGDELTRARGSYKVCARLQGVFFASRGVSPAPLGLAAAFQDAAGEDAARATIQKPTRAVSAAGLQKRPPPTRRCANVEAMRSVNNARKFFCQWRCSLPTVGLGGLWRPKMALAAMQLAPQCRNRHPQTLLPGSKKDLRRRTNARPWKLCVL